MQQMQVYMMHKGHSISHSTAFYANKPMQRLNEKRSSQERYILLESLNVHCIALLADGSLQCAE